MRAAVRDGSASGLIQVMLAAALWATVGVASQMLPREEMLSDMALGVSRMAVGGPIILVVALITGRAGRSVFRHLDPVRLLCFAVGCAVFQVCLFRAFTVLGVTATVFLTVCLPPLLSCLWSCLRGQQVLSRASALALGLSVAGLVAFAAGSGETRPPRALLSGLGLALLASLAFVVMTHSARSLTREVGPLVVVGLGLTLAGVLLLVGLWLLEPQALALPAHNDWHTVALMLYLGLCPTALAYVIYCAGMARCRSTTVGLIASMIEPALAALLAWALLSERLGPGELLGCALLTGAMALLSWSEGRVTAARAPQRPAM